MSPRAAQSEENMRQRLSLAFWTLLVAAMVPAVSAAEAPPSPAPAADPLKGLHFRPLGPIGNRASAVVGEPGNPLVIYLGAASGGIFKTANGGVSWTPIFDDQDVSSIGSLAIAPSNHSIVWAGTGEPWLIRPDHAMGDGIYKSVDAGKTWKRAGLEATGHIGRIIVAPSEPDTVYACALGQAYRPQHERGVFKTTDGGKTWNQVLFVNENTGCSELSIDARDPNTLFAGMWQVDIKTWKNNSGGPGGGVYVSHDAGQTWKKLAGEGLPEKDEVIGKTAVQVAPSNSDRVYALIEQSTPTLYRSDDGGKAWKVVNRSHVLAERAPYYVRFAVAPDNDNLLYFMSVSYSVSRDGGETLAKDMPDPSGDNHDIWIDPKDPKRVLVASDGGGSISLDGAKTWFQAVLPIAQMYHVAVDNQIPYYVYGNKQDGPSYMGPSNNLEGADAGISTGDWRQAGGCEDGFDIPDPQDPNITWSGCYGGQLDRTDMRTGQARSVMVWPDAAYGFAPADVKYRFHWTVPINISPHDHNVVYVGSQKVHMTSDGGQNWKDISPDLTLNDKSHEQSNAGMAADNLMTFSGAIIFSIAESPIEKGTIWAGTNDGQVQVTRNGGGSWTNVTKNIPNLPPWGTVFNIEPSHFDAGAAYITVDLQQVGNYDPYVYKTSDFGQTWKLISGTVPKSVSSFAHCVREDPVRKGMLYLGTDNALYVSWDDGAKWTRLKGNLPASPVYWIEVQPRFHDLVIATYGRGFWILDDISPLRTWDQTPTGDAHLFPTRPAYRFRVKQDLRARDANSAVVGENPPYGADITFFLKKAPKQLEITILGPDNAPIRTLRQADAKPGPDEDDAEKAIDKALGAVEVKGVAGFNRVWWDLRSDPLTPVKMRVGPPGEPWVRNGPKGYRRLVWWTPSAAAPRVPPGTYTVKVTADGVTMNERLEVLRDPNSLGSEQDLQAQSKFLRGLVDQINEAATMINNLEWTRAELGQARQRASESPSDAPGAKGLSDLEQKVVAAEGKLVDVYLSGRVEDSFRHPMGLYERMTNVLGQLAENGADLPPTQPQIDANKVFQQELADARAAYQAVMQSAGVRGAPSH
jgi:photosystem II stability/assembly factor-like uncharacterized protein